MKMNGMEHDMLMPGMLTDEEMAALDKARGPEFDRLFLLGMIKHHQGAITMVDELLKAYGAAQDDDIYKFASDVFADQSIEIERMKQMLEGSSGFDRRLKRFAGYVARRRGPDRRRVRTAMSSPLHASAFARLSRNRRRHPAAATGRPPAPTAPPPADRRHRRRAPPPGRAGAAGALAAADAAERRRLHPRRRRP